MIKRIHRFLSFLSGLLWIGLGLIVIGSIAVSSLGWGINLIVGSVMLLIGVFLGLRGRALTAMIESYEPEENTVRVSRFLRYDLILIGGISLIGLLLLAMSIYRVFGEGYAVFG